jgi:homoserine O-succinyltransferase/O-acetyltransferase
MPQAERYEASLLYPLGRSIIQIEPVWIRLTSHAYKTSDHAHLDRFYLPFADAVGERPLDGLILTGAPVEHLPYREVTYWEELSLILRFARMNIASTVGICWGGLALAKILGIEKVTYPMKVFGMYETTNLDESHPVTGDFDDRFFCPESRHAGIEDSALEAAAAQGIVRLLAHAEGAGYIIFEGADHRFLMHLGHPEYQEDRFALEYQRDKALGRNDVAAPLNVDLTHPENRWRMHGLEFFGQWVRYLYDCSNSASVRGGKTRNL